MLSRHSNTCWDICLFQHDLCGSKTGLEATHILRQATLGIERRLLIEDRARYVADDAPVPFQFRGQQTMSRIQQRRYVSVCSRDLSRVFIHCLCATRPGKTPSLSLFPPWDACRYMKRPYMSPNSSSYNIAFLLLTLADYKPAISLNRLQQHRIPDHDTPNQLLWWASGQLPLSTRR